jgi:hypothetical protein
MPLKILDLLSGFRPAFSRQAAFLWFTVVILGFLLRFDHYGVSSFVRWLSMPETTYPLILHFFHASSWSLGEVMILWMGFCQEKFPLVSHNGRLLVLGDGIKIPKESRRQPGIKFLHSPSQNQTKPQRFLGHHFGCIAFVAQIGNTFRAILQLAQIHEGVDGLRNLQHSASKTNGKESSVSRMMSLLTLIAIQQGKPLYAVLDAFFATSVAFNFVYYRLQEDGSPWVHLITCAKNNYVAYIEKKSSKKTRVKLWSLFENLELFMMQEHPLDPTRTIQIYSRDLYWGTSFFFLRFVWVVDGAKKFILMSSDTTLSPLAILKMYGLRSKIELSFRILKHLIGGFGYRFWSSFCQTIKTSGVLVNQKVQMKKILIKLTAIERYVNLAIIAQGILSYFALMKSEWVWSIHRNSSWLRSYSSVLPSEEVAQRALQSYYMLSFSLEQIKNWVKNKCKLLPMPKKVWKNHTLGHFLLS